MPARVDPILSWAVNERVPGPMWAFYYPGIGNCADIRSGWQRALSLDGGQDLVFPVSAAQISGSSRCNVVSRETLDIIPDYNGSHQEVARAH